MIGDEMIINYTAKDLEYLARIMRAEALAEGDLGMLMVGNVVTNRAIANCLTFKNITTIYDSIFQQGQFSGTTSYLFEAAPTKLEKNLAERVLRGEYYYPATHSLWFYAPGVGNPCRDTWYGQSLAGKYKNHCFYNPAPGVCNELV